MRIEIGPYSEGRKLDIHIDEWDTWNLDHTLALIIVPCLKQLRDTNHGHPSDLTEEEWINIQNKMIWAFEQILDNDNEDQFFSGKADIYFEEIPGTDLSELKRGPKDTFKLDYEGLARHREMIQEGLDLFAKYFRDLWD